MSLQRKSSSKVNAAGEVVAVIVYWLQKVPFCTPFRPCASALNRGYVCKETGQPVDDSYMTPTGLPYGCKVIPACNCIHLQISTWHVYHTLKKMKRETREASHIRRCRSACRSARRSANVHRPLFLVMFVGRQASILSTQK